MRLQPRTFEHAHADPWGDVRKPRAKDSSDNERMHVLLAAALFATPFWEVKDPREWNRVELQTLTQESPWAQLTETSGDLSPPVQVYLATATPLRQAEAEFARRSKIEVDPLREEYEAFLREEGRKSIVLAVYVADPTKVAEGAEAARMEDESVLKIGRKRLKMTGHFPPTRSDPFLRMIFPRPEIGEQKKISFEVYVPGIPGPYREAEFAVKDLVYRGKPDY
jgi:hypothetical protein